MIAARRGHATLGALAVRQPHQLIGRTAQLERPGRLTIFEFEIDLRGEFVTKAR